GGLRLVLVCVAAFGGKKNEPPKTTARQGASDREAVVMTPPSTRQALPSDVPRNPGLDAAAIIRVLPGDAVLIAVVNVQHALRTPIGKKYLRPGIEEVVKQQPFVARNLKNLGIDPFKDLQFVMAVNSESAGDDPLLLLQGNFDPTQFGLGDGLKLLEVSDSAGGTYPVFEVSLGPLQPPYFAVKVGDHLMALTHDKTTVV